MLRGVAKRHLNIPSNIPDKDLLALGLFGCCPLLINSTTLLSGLVMGAAALSVLLLSSITVSLYRYFIPHQARLVFLLLINAGWVTVLDLLLQAWLYEMRQQLGIYIPLLAVNVVLMLILEHQALKQRTWLTMQRATATGLALALGLLLLGGLRELLASGGLLTDIALLPLPSITASVRPIYFIDHGALLFNKAAGAFICLGLFVAGVSWLGEKFSVKAEQIDH